MTTFTGPLNVNEAVSGTGTETRFRVSADGKIESGTSAGQLNPTILMARANLGQTSSVQLGIPTGAEIISFNLYTDIGVGSAAKMDVRIGTSADTDQIGAWLTQIPAATTVFGIDSMTVSGPNNWASLAAGPLIVDVTSVASADTAWQGHIAVTYVR